MSSDEEKIRTLVEEWMAASKAGDTATVLSLMTEDALFTVAGREPFGKNASRPPHGVKQRSAWKASIISKS